MSVANNLIKFSPSLYFFYIITGRWCRREWSSPPDSRANDPSRRVLYSSVFLGSPGKCEIFFLLSIIIIAAAAAVDAIYT